MNGPGPQAEQPPAGPDMSVEPEMILFIAAAVLTVIVAVVVGLLIRRALREDARRAQAERAARRAEAGP